MKRSEALSRTIRIEVFIILGCILVMALAGCGKDGYDPSAFNPKPHGECSPGPDSTTTPITSIVVTNHCTQPN